MNAQTSNPETPLIAIVGRPNVGKSTVFNRLVGSRRAIVGDEPGITRDRLYGNGEWLGRTFRVVDTGGIIPEDKEFIPSEIFRQAKVALEEAAAVIMVVDARAELTGPDMELARRLIRSGKPVFLAINKIDSDKQERLSTFTGWGSSRYSCFHRHGRGFDDCWMVLAKSGHRPNKRPPQGTQGNRNSTVRPKSHHRSPTWEIYAVKSAHWHRPLDCLAHSRPTRDAVDEVVAHNGRQYRYRYRRNPP
jgi:GTP-binding protein